MKPANVACGGINLTRQLETPLKKAAIQSTDELSVKQNLGTPSRKPDKHFIANQVSVSVGLETGGGARFTSEADTIKMVPRGGMRFPTFLPLKYLKNI